MKRIATLVAVFALLPVAQSTAANHHPVCQSAKCKRTAARACHRDHACRERVTRKQLAREMAYYRRHQMPWCTWGPESSGPPYAIPAFSMTRYRAYNSSSGAAGKFQIIPSTWANIGGLRYSNSARDAPPVIQERLARRLMRKAGIRGTWANC